MKPKVGDIYIRNSDGQVCRVRWIDRTTVILETEDGRHLRLTSIYGLKNEYSQRDSAPVQKTPARLS